MSDFDAFAGLPSIEDKLMESMEFQLGWRCGSLFSGVSFMMAGFLDDHDIFAIRTFMPVEGAEMLLRISDLTNCHVHTHDIDENMLQACFIRGIERTGPPSEEGRRAN